MITDEQLAEAEAFASLPFGVPDLSVVLGMRVEVVRLAIDDQASPLGQAIKRGWLKAKAEKMRIINTLAAQGSTPAMHMALEFINRIEQ